MGRYLADEQLLYDVTRAGPFAYLCQVVYVCGALTVYGWWAAASARLLLEGKRRHEAAEGAVAAVALGQSDRTLLPGQCVGARTPSSVTSLVVPVSPVL